MATPDGKKPKEEEDILTSFSLSVHSFNDSTSVYVNIMHIDAT